MTSKAMAECNAQRAHLGLPPLMEDPRLTSHAQLRAQYCADRGISLYGRTRAQREAAANHKGSFTPEGEWRIVEGLGAMPPDEAQDTWATCAMRAVGNNLEAGAGLAWGKDGVRYMALIIRAETIDEGGREIPLIPTDHITGSPQPPERREEGRLTLNGEQYTLSELVT